MLGYSAEQVVTDVRRCSNSDKCSEVWHRWHDTAEGRVKLTRYSLLNDPNTSSPANVEASNLYKENRKEYTKRVRETVEKSWDD